MPSLNMLCEGHKVIHFSLTDATFIPVQLLYSTQMTRCMCRESGTLPNVHSTQCMSLARSNVTEHLLPNPLFVGTPATTFITIVIYKGAENRRVILLPLTLHS